MRIRLPASIIIVAAVGFLLPAAANAARAPVLQALNAQRAAHGIPAGITENPAWSAGCNAHVNYMNLNNYFGHDQDPTKIGYTPAGAEAGKSSVLTSRGWEYADQNPFELAPIHLAQLLAPALSVIGFSDQGGCVTTWPGYQRPYPDNQTRIYSYPGNGTKDWRFSEYTYEKLGLKNPTGPHIYLFTFGPSMRETALSSGTLTGPSGEVIETRFVRSGDSSNLISGLPSGTGIVIPVKPLAPESTYTLRSDWNLLAPAGTWSYDQKVADLRRIWALFAIPEATQTRELNNFSRDTASGQNENWNYFIRRCERAASGFAHLNSPPYNMPLPTDTACRISQYSRSDTRSFSTKKDKADDSPDSGYPDSDSSLPNTTRISLHTKPRGRRALLTLHVGNTWIGQRVKLRLVWRSGPGRKTVRKTQTVTLKKKTYLTLKAPWKQGRVTLNVKGATQAINDTPARTITHKRSWKIR